MIEVRSIEVRYSGVVVGRSTRVRDWDTGGAFIGFAEPLPSGTSLVLRGDGVDQPARVVEVFESADPAVAGMQVKFIGAAEAARPAPKPAAAAAKPAPEPARVPEPAVVATPAVTATAERPPVAAAAEGSPAEEPGAPSSVATSEQGEGEPGQAEQAEQSGQPGQAGKRRRRRR